MKKVKWSRYRPGVAQRVGRGIALLLHDRGTRRGWVVSVTPRPLFTPGKDLVPILQEAGWTPGPVWTCGKSRPHRNSIPNRPARSSVTIPTELPDPHIIHIYIYSMYTHPRTHARTHKHIYDAKRSDPCVLWCDAVSLELWLPTFRHTPEHLVSVTSVATTSNLAA